MDTLSNFLETIQQLAPHHGVCPPLIYSIPLKPPRRQRPNDRKRWRQWHRSVSQKSKHHHPQRYTTPWPSRRRTYAAPPGLCHPTRSRSKSSSHRPTPVRRLVPTTCSNRIQTPTVPHCRTPKLRPAAVPKNPSSPPGPSSPCVDRIEEILATSPPAPHPPPSNYLNVSPEELEHAALRALHQPPAPNESLRDSHLRIDAAFAASAQLEEFYLAKHHPPPSCPPYFLRLLPPQYLRHQFLFSRVLPTCLFHLSVDLPPRRCN